MEELDPIEEALRSLQHKGLIEPDGFGSYQPTEKGAEVVLLFWNLEVYLN